MRRSMSTAVALVPAALVVVLAACTTGGSLPMPSSAPETSGSDESEPESVTPSITREVPPQRRIGLADASAEQLCGLVTVDELGQLAYPVRHGVPREIGLEPPVRGCQFAAENGVRSILVGTQPEGYAELGQDEVRLGERPGTETLRANDCTVFAAASGATLQVTARAAEADGDECETAQGVAQYVLAGVR
ncbi:MULTISPECIES: DUF3558 family protein [Saccharopolyspora]|uniref:DUF3558 domain-containing protein n=2 Tax=Saccharopolyspora TaxID=1835 RepID=A0ABP6S0U2_9PSEU|nr:MULTISPECIES: DUF3558 family protein [Saccharopolyspora]MCA1191037.1 DUF3558 family protein [Saccharopolyspora sp. 6V]MCA1225982.1 DUF3558 family protein [Saccharopolyspora sp. 6M]